MLVEQSFNAKLYPHPLKHSECTTVEVKVGCTLRELIPEETAAVILWQGRPIPEDWWPHLRPKPGAEIIIRTLPGDSDVLRAVLTIAVAVVAAWVVGPEALALTGWQAAAVSTGFTIAGSLLINALIRPPSQKLDGIGQQEQRPSISGTRNQFAPYATVPKLYGRHRVFPPLGGRPYTEILGDDQFLHMLFCIGHGNVLLTDLKLGDTPIDQTYEEIQYQRLTSGDQTTLQYYRTDIDETPLSFTLKEGDIVASAVTNALAVSLDFTLPAGLVFYSEKGGRKNALIDYLIEYSVTGSGVWNPVTSSLIIDKSGPFIYVPDGTGYDESFIYPSGVPSGTWRLMAADPTTIRAGLKINVSGSGNFTVRVTHLGYRYLSSPYTLFLGEDNEKMVAVSAWTAIRAHRTNTPLSLNGYTWLEMRIRASGRLNGVVDNFNCLGQAQVPDWNGSSWVTQATRNPASAYRDILTGLACARPVVTGRLDNTELQAWHVECASDARTFDYVFSSQSTVFEALGLATAIGRASFGNRDGLYSVVRDLPNAAYVQAITPRNSWGFNFTRQYQPLPHALKVRFIDPDNDWQESERVVYDDDYNSGNATRFETLTFPGVTVSSFAWKLGRYHMAQARLRPEVFSWYMDFEYLVAGRGSRVPLQHDAMLVGLAAGRIQSIQTSGSNVTGITIDEPVTFDGVTTYGVRIRLATGLSIVKALANPGLTTTAVFVFAVTEPTATGIEVDNLVQFGVSGLETIDAIITAIEPAGDMVARITAVPAAPAVLNAPTGLIPDYNPGITQPADPTRVPPDPPIKDAERSDESALEQTSGGNFAPRILINFHFASTTRPVAQFVEARYWRTDDPSRVFTRSVAAHVGQIALTDVVQGVYYDFQMRSISYYGVPSQWLGASRHLVIGASTPPPDVTTFMISGTKLTWTYPNEPIDFKGFLLRYHLGQNTLWDDAIALHTAAIDGREFNLDGNTPISDITLMIKAVDQSGNVSVTAAIIITGLGDRVVDNILYEKDYEALGFPGTKTNCTVSGGDLVADAQGVSNPFWGSSDTAAFWSGANTALFWTDQFLGMAYDVTFSPPAEWTGPDTRMLLDPTFQGEGIQLLYDPGDQSPFWDTNNSLAFWSANTDTFWPPYTPAYQPWPGVITGVGLQDYMFRFSTNQAYVQGKLFTFKVILDVPDIVERFEDLAVGTPSTTLPITKTYRAIKIVSITLQDDGGSARTAQIVSKSATAPAIRALDSAGSATTAVCDVTVQGY